MKLVKVIRLPFALPTWNRLLGVNHWQRRKIRHHIHNFVRLIVEEKEIPKQELLDYEQCIRPKARKNSTHKKVSKVRNRKTIKRVSKRKKK